MYQVSADLSAWIIAYSEPCTNKTKDRRCEPAHKRQIFLSVLFRHAFAGKGIFNRRFLNKTILMPNSCFYGTIKTVGIFCFTGDPG
jgi:hypothetical protein